MSTRSFTVSVPDRYLYDALVGQFDDVTVLEWGLTGPAPADVLDLVVADYLLGPEQFRFLATVETTLLQWQSIGFNGLAEVLPPGIVVANAASVHEASTAELAVGLMIAGQRDLATHIRNGRDGRWALTFRPSLADARVLLLGYGGVGRAIEDRLLAFEVVMTRVARTARVADRGPVHGIDELPSLLPDADILVIALPLNDDTVGLVDAGVLAGLRDNALVVNVGRGQVADTAALTAEASRDRLRLALDVIEPEPLAPEHPLWSLPNVLLTPHIGGASSAMEPRMLQLVRDQIERLRRGDPPRNVVLRT